MADTVEVLVGGQERRLAGDEEGGVNNPGAPSLDLQHPGRSGAPILRVEQEPASRGEGRVLPKQDTWHPHLSPEGVHIHSQAPATTHKKKREESVPRDG